MLKKGGVTCQGMGQSVDNFLEEMIPRYNLDGGERVKQDPEGRVSPRKERKGIVSSCVSAEVATWFQGVFRYLQRVLLPFYWSCRFRVQRGCTVNQEVPSSVWKFFLLPESREKLL